MCFDKPKRIPLLQFLWVFFGLAMLLQSVGVWRESDTYVVLLKEEKEPMVKSTQVLVVTPRPRIFFLEQLDGGTPFRAKQQRQVAPIWEVGGWDKNHKFSDPTADVFRNSIPVDGKGKKEDCVPAADWQTTFQLNCNAFHELDFRPSSEANENKSKRNPGFATDMLGIGTSIFAWNITNDIGDPVVLKTLKLDCTQGCEFSHKFFGKQRVDAVAAEQLTSSPYVLDIFGFCGMSVMNELGRMFEKDQQMTTMDRLRFSRDLAAGMADMQGINAGVPHPMLTHGDFKHTNVIFSYDKSVLKLSDFNKGHFLETNQKTGKACGYFKPPSHSGLDILAPEEIYGTIRSHMTDVYHLGGMIFHILTNHKPYFWNGKDVIQRRKEQLDKLGDWMQPMFPEEVADSKDPAIITMKKAIKGCFRLRPKDRSSANDILQMLNSTLTKLDNAR